MPKKLNTIKTNTNDFVMDKIRSNQIMMKPKWFFLLGSILVIIGFVASSIGAVFLTNITFFILRQHGPYGQFRLEQLLDNFSWWIPLLAILGLVSGIALLKKYDFSYKRNFWIIILGFILSILISAFLLDYLGLNDVWSRQGPMRRFYQQIEGKNTTRPRDRGQFKGYGRMQNGNIIELGY